MPVSRFCNLCDYTGIRKFTDHRGRTVAGRCKCNPAPAQPPTKKPEPKQPNLLPEEWMNWFK